VVAGGEGVAVCVSRRAAVGHGVMDLDVVVECGGFVSWWCRVRHGLTCASDDVTDCHTDHQERRHRPSDVGSGPSDVGTAAAPSRVGYVGRTGSRPPPRRHVVMGCGHGPTAGFRRRHLVAALVAVGQVGGCSVGHRVSATDRGHWSATMVAGSRRTDGVRSMRGHSGRRRRMQQRAASSSRRRPAAAAAASLLIHLQPVLRLLLTPPAAVSFSRRVVVLLSHPYADSCRRRLHRPRSRLVPPRERFTICRPWTSLRSGLASHRPLSVPHCWHRRPRCSSTAPLSWLGPSATS
jgi:hypothetical protein